MEHKPSNSTPRDVFLYLLAIITLYLSIWRFINLLFGYINILLPDRLDMHFTGILNEMRISIAMLIVVFPVYMGLTWYLRKDMIVHPEKREFRVRKWLLNFTLFLAAITIIADLIILIHNFLNGELTMRFFLKVLVVLVVAAAVFSYYLWDLKRETLAASKPSRVLLILVSSIVAISVIASFFIIGSPKTQRGLRFDEQRVNDLQMLQSEVINYWIQKNALPKTLDYLKNDITGFRPPHDPENDAPYKYKILSGLEFELCANFSLPSRSYDSEYASRRPYYPPYAENPYGANWTHRGGEACFQRVIDPEIYRPKSVPVSKLGSLGSSD